MTKKQEREQLISVYKKALELNIVNCKFLCELFKKKGDLDTIKVLENAIEKSEKALVEIDKIEHLEILRAIYNDYVNKISSHLVMGGALVISPKIQEWDKTEKGYNEFVIANKEALKLAKQKAKEQQESQLAIQKAQEQGKKVQMLYDPVTKKVKPIIEENNNA